MSENTTGRQHWDNYCPTPRSDPPVEVLMPVHYLTPDSPCPHRYEIQPGEPVYCAVCHKSGYDHQRRMKVTREDLTFCNSKTFIDQWGNTPVPFDRPSNGLKGGRTK